MTKEGRSLAVAAKIIVCTVSTLVADTSDFIFATIADNATVWSVVNLEGEFAREGDGNKAVTSVMDLGQGETFLAKVVVRTLEALVSDTNDDGRTNVAVGRMLHGLGLLAWAGA